MVGRTWTQRRSGFPPRIPHVMPRGNCIEAGGCAHRLGEDLVMRAWWMTGCVVVLTGLTAGAGAEEFAWRPAAGAAPPAPVASTAPGVSLGSPVGVGLTAPRPAAATGPSLPYKARAAGSDGAYLPPIFPMWSAYSPNAPAVGGTTPAPSGSPYAGARPAVLPTNYANAGSTAGAPPVVSASGKPQWGEWATDDRCFCGAD